MAERTITIRIVSQQNSAPSPDAQSGNSDVSKPSVGADSGEGSGNESGGGSKAAIVAAASYLTKQTLAMVKQNVDYGLNRYFDLTENYKSQQNMENIKAQLGVIGSVAGSTVSGATLGAQFGPLGAIIGAVFGLAVGVTNVELNKTRTLEAQERSMHENAFALYFNTVRGGQVNYSRGTEN